MSHLTVSDRAASYLIVIAATSPPPAPWQRGWTASRDDVPGLSGRVEIARAATGTPIPSGARVVRPGWRPAPTAAQSDAVRAHDERDVAGVVDPAALDRRTEEAIGVPHHLAWYAPLALSASEASDAHARALSEWNSEAAGGVIRAAHAGYEIWLGIGGLLRSVGNEREYPAAEDRLVRAGQAHRADLGRYVRRILDGWSPATPYQSATLDDYQRRVPFVIRRGPVTGGGNSYDLPVVATWRDGVIERHAVELPWDDDRDRTADLERRRAGEARAAELRQRR